MVKPLPLNAEHKAHLAGQVRRRLASCVPWSRSTRWQPELNITGASYKTLNIFPEVRPSDREVYDLRPGEFADSPNKEFRYAVKLHRRSHPLTTWWGPNLGTVVFDDDVEIPILFQRKEGGEPGEWNVYPWMSLTPGEILTLRVGTKLAKGHVVIGGLGLGHQLIEVSKRNAVKEITLVELSQELVDWYLPQVVPHLGGKKLNVHVGNAFEIIPTLKADVGLLDMFPRYGENHAPTKQLARKSKGIKKMWGWGTSEEPRRG